MIKPKCQCFAFASVLLGKNLSDSSSMSSIWTSNQRHSLAPRYGIDLFDKLSYLITCIQKWRAFVYRQIRGTILTQTANILE